MPKKKSPAGHVEAAKRPRKPKGKLGNFIFLGFALCWLYFFSLQLKSNHLPKLNVETNFANVNRQIVKYYQENYWIPALTTLIYLGVVFVLPSLIRGEPPFIKPLLILWNAILASGSCWGAFRMATAFYEQAWSTGTSCTYATDQSENCFCVVGGFRGFCGGYGETGLSYIEVFPAQGFWLWAFCTSKIPEMIDTLFLVVRGRPVIFLHWYHHISVMWFCWNAYAEQVCVGHNFAIMNLIVHSFMYTYYMLAAMGIRPWRFANLITIIQILQMFGGSFIAGYIFFKQSSCSNPGSVIYSAAAMYGSYLLLFVKLFWDKNFGSPKKKKTS